MTNRNKLTNEECVDIQRRIAAGEKRDALAEAYSVNYYTITSALQRAESLISDPVALNGAEERAKAIEKMDELHCGGCGQEGLCEPVGQRSRRFPEIMWLCGICRETGVWR